MINEKDLREFMEYMRSGQIEEDFFWSSEERRYEMLDLLELLMDAGELADELATRIIFKDSGLDELMTKK